MTLFPGLEAALDEAAVRRYPRRRPRSWARWVAAPALAVCAVALVVAVMPEERATHPEAAAPPPPVTVAPETLAQSRALVDAPTPDWRDVDDRLAHAELPGVAAEIAARVPYAPGARESMDWAGTPKSPTDMSSIGSRVAVQFLVEYRAACTWAAFWLWAQQEGNTAALAGATAVLQDIPHWPALRGSLEDPYERTVGWPLNAKAAAAGDVAPVRQYAVANCTAIPSPYTAAIR
ncbi:hypothetical protein OJ997_06235 [Solirubrobacter phytolaccae]|uniref:Uncharacterized protein n=1 Tax=Solirubrobacter phytolaccae TaxID=1404360 RepID=A0A9X3S851_9ACTN|nr:hypothetical protein [Solirubrobacter phytolaccae]MDA0179886.1 hypothetical protein [Solirubrobacter phytolaccae]